MADPIPPKAEVVSSNLAGCAKTHHSRTKLGAPAGSRPTLHHNALQHGLSPVNEDFLIIDFHPVDDGAQT